MVQNAKAKTEEYAQLLSGSVSTRYAFEGRIIEAATNHSLTLRGNRAA